jgi:type VI secretion system secreted protein VgrG
MKRYQKRSIPILIVAISTTFAYASSTVADAVSPLGSTTCAGSTTKQATSIDLTDAAGFSVFAGAAITNVGRSFINSKIGVDPGTAITGNETIFNNGSATATAAEIKYETNLVLPSLIAANSEITRQKVVNGFSPIAAELGAQIVCPGIYKSDAAFGLTGNLTLDGNNDPNSLFIFITPAAITTAAASKMILTNGAHERNIFWQSGAAATLGASSFFKGTILAEAAITAGNGVHVHGRLLSKSAAVTLDRNCVIVPDIATDIACSAE